MAQVVDQANAFHQVAVEAQALGHAAGDLCHFHGVGQARAKKVAAIVGENLGFIGEAAEGAGVDNAVAVALEGGAPGVFVAGVIAAAGVSGAHGPGGQVTIFPLFDEFARRAAIAFRHGGRV